MRRSLQSGCFCRIADRHDPPLSAPWLQTIVTASEQYWTARGVPGCSPLAVDVADTLWSELDGVMAERGAEATDYCRRLARRLVPRSTLD